MIALFPLMPPWPTFAFGNFISHNPGNTFHWLEVGISMSLRWIAFYEERKLSPVVRFLSIRSDKGLTIPIYVWYLKEIVTFLSISLSCVVRRFESLAGHSSCQLSIGFRRIWNNCKSQFILLHSTCCDWNVVMSWFWSLRCCSCTKTLTFVVSLVLILQLHFRHLNFLKTLNSP